jgi:hypothetical protein
MSPNHAQRFMAPPSSTCTRGCWFSITLHKADEKTNQKRCSCLPQPSWSVSDLAEDGQWARAARLRKGLAENGSSPQPCPPTTKITHNVETGRLCPHCSRVGPVPIKRQISLHLRSYHCPVGKLPPHSGVGECPQVGNQRGRAGGPGEQAGGPSLLSLRPAHYHLSHSASPFLWWVFLR